MNHTTYGSRTEVQKRARAQYLIQQRLTVGPQQAPEREVISLAPIVDEVVRVLRSTLPAAVEVVRSVGSNVPKIRGNTTQIHKLLVSLCMNAGQAMEGNSGQIEVRLESVFLDAAKAAALDGIDSGQLVCLSVSDTGKGMDQATRQRIFEPFFTTKLVGERAGLGLPESARKVVSGPDQGTTFYLCFPSVQQAPGESTPGEPCGELREKPLGTPHIRSQHILYLDDEEPLAYVATELLEGLGYSVTSFTSSADGLQAFRESPEQFDLIVTDFNMPGASGLQVATEVLRLRPDIPVVLSSGYITEDQKEKVRRAGIREIIDKTSIEELSEAIHRLLCAPT